jgi:serine/threonine protein kinase
MIGGYTLVERLGVGGTASVYLGRKRLHDGFEWVALKCLHPHLVELDEVETMFLVEAELLSRLHHPNVCEILRYGTEDGIPFIATRYLRGAPFDRLQKKLMGRRIPLELMAWIVAEACAGLHHAHEARNDEGAHLGIVHRDVSPQNIFVTFDGKVQLLDFGVAHAAISSLKSESTGEVKGKDGYMSPEQTNGGALDRRSDIFSLGIVLWEAITGRRLFARENALATALAISEQPAPDAASINPRVSTGLARITKKALAIEAEDRFSTAQEMERALRAELADDLSPQIQLQVLMREVLDHDPRDPPTDLDLRSPGASEASMENMWADATKDDGDDDDDLADLTEIADPTLRDLADSTLKNLRAAAQPDADDTVSVSAPASREVVVKPSTLPEPNARRSWILGLVAVLISIAAAIFLVLSH